MVPKRRLLVIFVVILIVCLMHYQDTEWLKKKTTVYETEKTTVPPLSLVQTPYGLLHENIPQSTKLVDENVSEKMSEVSPPHISPINHNDFEGNSSDIRIAQRFLRLRLQVQERCERLHPAGVVMTKKIAYVAVMRKRFIANVEKRMVMCLSLKAGSTSWHNLFWQLRDPATAAKETFSESHMNGNLLYYNSLKREQRIALWKDTSTVKLMNTRHPFARLISGWSDKFTKRYYHKVWYQRYPRLKNYGDEYKTWNGSGRFMTWPNFARYVAENGQELRNLDEHFLPVVSDCNPCQIPFDLIIKAETFSESSSWLLREIMGVDPKQMLLRNVSTKQEDPVSKIRKMFQQLDRNTIRSLMKIYKTDFDIFGYTFDLETLTAGGWEQ